MKYYSAVVKKNLSIGGADAIEVYVPELTTEYKDTAEDTVEVPLNLNALNLDEENDLSNATKIETSANFIAYPSNGTGSAKSGSVIVPDIGDNVLVYYMDNDTSQLYYKIGSKKNEQTTGEDIKQPTMTEFASLSDGEGAREKVKVVHKTKSEQGLAFSEGEIEGAILKNRKSHLKMHSDKMVELISEDAGADALGIRADIENGKIEIYNGSGTIFITSDGTNFTVEVTGNGTVKAPQGLKIDAPTTTFTGDVQVDGGIHSDGDTVAGSVSLKSHTHNGVQAGGSNTGGPN